MDQKKPNKILRVYNVQTGALIESRNYEETKERYSQIVAAFSPRGKNFTDRDLLDALDHYNSYSRFEIEYE